MSRFLSCIVMISTYLASALSSVYAQPPPDAEPPFTVVVSDVTVTVPATGNLPAHSLFIKEATSGNDRFLFPAFELLDATVRYSVIGGGQTQPSRLLRLDGTANVLTAEDDTVERG